MVHMYVKNVLVGSTHVPSAIILAPVPTGQNEAPRESGANGTAAQAPVGDALAATTASGARDDSTTAVRVHDEKANRAAHFDDLPINVGVIEATGIGMAIDGVRRPRPMTHDLLLNVIGVLGGKLNSVSITRVEGTTFYATLDITDANGVEHRIDARPSDAISLALREEVPILASEKLLEQAGMPDFSAIKKDEQERELDSFHAFIEGLSPEDFKAADQQ